MIAEVRDEHIDIIFDWPKTTTGEEKKHTVVSLAHLIHEMQLGNLLPAALSSLAIAGQLQNEREVAEHACKVIHHLLTQGDDSDSSPVQNGPIIRPTQLLSKHGGGHD